MGIIDVLFRLEEIGVCDIYRDVGGIRYDVFVPVGMPRRKEKRMEKKAEELITEYTPLLMRFLRHRVELYSTT